MLGHGPLASTSLDELDGISGACAQAVGAAQSAAGGLIFSGSSTQAASAAQSATGSLVFTGTITQAASAAQSATGDIEILAAEEATHGGHHHYIYTGMPRFVLAPIRVTVPAPNVNLKLSTKELRFTCSASFRIGAPRAHARKFKATTPRYVMNSVRVRERIGPQVRAEFNNASARAKDDAEVLEMFNAAVIQEVD